jgi:putative endopeptidase
MFSAGVKSAPLTVTVLAAVVLCAGVRPPAAKGEPVTQGPAPASNAGSLQSGVRGQDFDETVRPQDDFYRYVNGRWLARTEIPSDRSNYSVFVMLEEGAQRDLHTIAEDAARSGAAAGTDAQKVGDFYASFMDEAAIERRGLAPLKADLARIDALTSKRDIASYFGHAQRIAAIYPFTYSVAIDEKKSSEYVSVVSQSGIGMPDRDYYLSDDAQLKGVREKYRVYVKELLEAANTPDAAVAAQRVFALESKLAKASWSRVQNRDDEKTYNRYDLAALGKLTPAFDWNAFLAAAQVPVGKVKAVIVMQPSYFQALNGMIADVPVADWRAYFRYQLLNSYAPELPAKFVKLHFEFNDRTVSGIEELKPRWKQALDTMENAIGDLVGKLYVERHFRADAKRRIDQLVGNLEAAFAESIDSLEWMTPATKQKAHEKLAQLATKIGYPERWRDWSRLEVRRDDLIGNEMRASAVVFDRGVNKLGGPIDKTEWDMTPQTVNAYNDTSSNSIEFPAAILQPPFFDVTADDAVNYGAIGAIIGHEISHGFDDQGRRYDGAGNMNDWWAPQDSEEFTRRAKLLGAQYSALSPIAGMHINGDLTMGENIADLAGVATAYRAYRLSLQGRPAPVIGGFTGDQRFFIGWAQCWARKYREDELRKRLLTDSHSPGEYRTNAILANLAEFYAAFDVKAGDKMYRDPKDRVRIW